MPRRKKDVKYAKLGEKESWHPYGLQALGTDRFILIVNRILCGRLTLLNLRFHPPLRG